VRVSAKKGANMKVSTLKRKNEIEFECEDNFFLHTQEKKSVSVGLSVCASGACEEKAKAKRSYSNSHSLWPLCPLLGAVLTKS
jgi:hypothetical protein